MTDDNQPTEVLTQVEALKTDGERFLGTAPVIPPTPTPEQAQDATRAMSLSELLEER